MRRSKLTREQVLAIYNCNEGTYREIGRKFGVSTGMVSHIKTGHRHQDITETQGEQRKKTPAISREKMKEIFDFLDNGGSRKDAEEYFNVPKWTVHRVHKEYSRKYRLKRYGNF